MTDAQLARMVSDLKSDIGGAVNLRDLGEAVRYHENRQNLVDDEVTAEDLRKYILNILGVVDDFCTNFKEIHKDGCPCGGCVWENEP